MLNLIDAQLNRIYSFHHTFHRREAQMTQSNASRQRRANETIGQGRRGAQMSRNCFVCQLKKRSANKSNNNTFHYMSHRRRSANEPYHKRLKADTKPRASPGAQMKQKDQQSRHIMLVHFSLASSVPEATGSKALGIKGL